MTDPAPLPPRSPTTIAAVEALADRIRACRTPGAVIRVATEIAPEVKALAATEKLIAIDLRNLAEWQRQGIVEGWIPIRPQPAKPPARKVTA